ncbi:hypothetical protein JCM19233_5372 [Vibrio astriarenae]|nr:hypothetical protein JCM19233_5372 [Vibrio sp. C7]
MAENQTSQDKSEKPSPQKLRKAKREGQAARSKEFVVGVLFIAIALFLWLMATILVSKQRGCLSLITSSPTTIFVSPTS